MKHLGIDYGTKNIGLALGDDETRLATPFKIIENKGIDKALAALMEFIEDEGIEQIVVGVPYSLKERDGRLGEQEREVLDFIRRLGMATTVPIDEEDERFTSVQVDNLMSAKDLAGGKRDAVSAMLILQSYLDKLKN